jgi:hypothetical protein
METEEEHFEDALLHLIQEGQVDAEQCNPASVVNNYNNCSFGSNSTIYSKRFPKYVFDDS